jgi:dihydroorotate dehydrogenase (NAD+) catalytic subunit
MTAIDALEFFIAGATAVQIGTANFVNSHATLDIIDGIEKFLAQKKIERIADIIGTLETNSSEILE